MKVGTRVKGQPTVKGMGEPLRNIGFMSAGKPMDTTFLEKSETEKTELLQVIRLRMQNNSRLNS